GVTRAKFNNIPIPNGDVTLNGPELVADARAQQEQLRSDLKAMLEELTYDKLAAKEAEKAEALQRSIREVPLGIYIGSLALFYCLPSIVNGGF
ncbi:MAG TPA: hypothetical protein VFT74_16285, partial [Isosphaeraceae bacterium]|nr:hypothetical protein [Isosphaeraceae bacterium]